MGVQVDPIPQGLDGGDARLHDADEDDGRALRVQRPPGLRLRFDAYLCRPSMFDSGPPSGLTSVLS